MQFDFFSGLSSDFVILVIQDPETMSLFSSARTPKRVCFLWVIFCGDEWVNTRKMTMENIQF